MPKATLIPVLALAVLIAGCVPPVSLDPLYTEENLIFDPALLGDWQVEINAEDGRCTFGQAAEKEYEMDCVFEGSRATFEARLLRLGSHTFLDTAPLELLSENTLALAHLVPGHIFSRVNLEGDTLRLTQMNVEWLNKQLDAGAVQITHRRIEEGVLLLAPTAELQPFFLEHADDPDAFSLSQEWTRIPPPVEDEEGPPVQE